MAKRRNPERICAGSSSGLHYVRMRVPHPGGLSSETIIAAILLYFPPGFTVWVADEFLRLPPANGLGAMKRALVTVRRVLRISS